MKKKYVITLIVLATLLISGIGLSLSYALWQITGNQKGVNMLNSGCFQIDFEETGTDINLTNAYPISDKEGLAKVPYKFKITNNCTIKAKYIVTLNSFGEKEKMINDKAIAYAFSQSSKKEFAKQILAKAKENKETAYIEVKELNKSYILEENELSIGETKEFSLYLWLDESATTSEVKKVFQSKIYIISSATTPQPTIIKRNIENPNYLNGLIKNEEIESIEFMNTNNVPVEAIGSWDVSEEQNGSIMAWYTHKDQNKKYELYIGQVGGVKANPDSSRLFENLINLTSLKLDYFITSEVDNIDHIFSKTALTQLDLSHFDTSNVVNMAGMFAYSPLTSVNVSHFDTSKVKDMRSMFSSTSITNIDVSHFITANVEDMSNMFSSTGLTQLDLSKFDTSKVTNMENMFAYTPLLTIDLSNFTTLNVINMTSMFQHCTALTALNLSRFDTSKVENMNWMFKDCMNLETINLSNCETPILTNLKETFYGCENLTKLYLTKMTFDKVIDAKYSFEGLSSTITIYVKDATQANKIKSFGAIGTILDCSSGLCP